MVPPLSRYLMAREKRAKAAGHFCEQSGRRVLLGDVTQLSPETCP
jgi:hypothetical protein